jgi:hypothetical protein
MSIEDTIRAVVREEVRAAFAELAPQKKWEGTLKLADAGKLVSVSVSTLEKWGKEGLRIHRKGRVRVVDVGELRAFIESRKAEPTQDAKDFAKQLLGTVTPLRRAR